MVFTPKIGDVVKIQNWHGVVLDVTFDEEGQLAVMQVQTPRNVFRNMGPEFIDVRLAPDKIQPATRQDLNAEIAFRQSLLEASIKKMLQTTEQPNTETFIAQSA